MPGIVRFLALLRVSKRRLHAKEVGEDALKRTSTPCTRIRGHSAFGFGRPALFCNYCGDFLVSTISPMHLICRTVQDECDVLVSKPFWFTLVLESFHRLLDPDGIPSGLNNAVGHERHYNYRSFCHAITTARIAVCRGQPSIRCIALLPAVSTAASTVACGTSTPAPASRAITACRLATSSDAAIASSPHGAAHAAAAHAPSGHATRSHTASDSASAGVRQHVANLHTGHSTPLAHKRTVQTSCGPPPSLILPVRTRHLVVCGFQMGSV